MKSEDSEMPRLEAWEGHAMHTLVLWFLLLAAYYVGMLEPCDVFENRRLFHTWRLDPRTAGDSRPEFQCLSGSNQFVFLSGHYLANQQYFFTYILTQQALQIELCLSVIPYTPTSHTYTMSRPKVIQTLLI